MFRMNNELQAYRNFCISRNTGQLQESDNEETDLMRIEPVNEMSCIVYFGENISEQTASRVSWAIEIGRAHV